MQALGGAKNHMVVLPDADLDAAADAAVSAGYGSAGERCMAISVVVAVDPIGDDLVDPHRRPHPGARRRRRGRRRAPRWARSSPTRTAQRVTGLVDEGVAEGADLVADGRGLVVEGHEDGFFLGPCLFDNVRPR